VKSKGLSRAALHLWQVCLFTCPCLREKRVRKRGWHARVFCLCVCARGRARATRNECGCRRICLCVTERDCAAACVARAIAACNRLMEDEEEKDFMCNLKCDQEPERSWRS